MIVFELPSRSGDVGLRCAHMGSCRVRNPLGVLEGQGDLKLCAQGLQVTHTAAEALQALNFVTGDLQIPDAISKYIFDSARAPPRQHLYDAIICGLDAVLLEISDDRVFSYREYFLQQHFVTMNLIRPHQGALLGWYRQLSRAGAADEACVDDALERLRGGGYRHDDEMADLLRNIRLNRDTGEDIGKVLAEMMSKLGGRWTVMGHFQVPEFQGAVMADRSALNRKLADAAWKCGADFYDPSELVSFHGRATALDDNGANIYEYSEAFYPIVGEALVNLARTARSTSRAGSSKAKNTVVSSGLRMASMPLRFDLAKRVNDELVALHRERLSRLGLEPSGLYAHYQAMLDRDVIVGPRERTVFELIDTYLPSYTAYGVLRAGLGEMALLLAARGQKTFAFERQPYRRAAIEAGMARLEAVGLLEPGTLTVVGDLAPDRPFEGSVLGIGLDAVLAADESNEVKLLTKMTAFDALLVDPRLFLRLRKNASEREKLIKDLDVAGFIRRRNYPRDSLIWFCGPADRSMTCAPDPYRSVTRLPS